MSSPNTHFIGRQSVISDLILMGVNINEVLALQPTDEELNDLLIGCERVAEIIALIRSAKP